MTQYARWFPSAVTALIMSTCMPQAHAGVAPHWEESGQASWYGPGFNGQRTSSGEVFDENALTAAHDWLPLGTKVRVTTQETGRSTVVTITDRLPPKRLRIIDLSREAASRLGLVKAGVGMVTLSAPDATDEPVEVAEAPDDDVAPVSPRLRGPRHTHRAARKALASPGCCHARSVARAPR